ncbi:carboxypeptidase A4-like [Nymphalis io]|uniref:carboxypeptidase A4-like n=1 Tax=Inachis io TaxID=171585 RepID=UPI002169F8DD|nr:carboxypeptidase A4-like [Nymphalis io]
MARRLALLALLACAAVANRRHLRSTDTSDSQSYDIVLWDDYDESIEKSLPTHVTFKPKTKVIVRNKAPKLNVTKKKTKSDEKIQVIKTTINISSQTNFIVTKPPQIVEAVSSSITRLPYKTFTNVNKLWIDSASQTLRPSTKLPIKPRPTSTRRPPKTVRPRITTTTKEPRTSTTRRPSTRRKLKTKVTCPPKNPNWISTYIKDNTLKKTPKNEVKSGLFSRVYNWFVESKSNWFNAGWFEDKSTTTTTPFPPSTSTGNWFELFLDSEDTDSSNVANEKIKKSAKKSLKKTYKGYQLLRTYPDLQWKLHSLLDLQEEAEGSGLMWWTSPSLNGSTDLLVPPDLLTDIKNHLKSSKIEFDVVIWDLQKAIAYENPKLSKKQRLELEQLRGHPMTWRRYHRYADILRYLEYLQHSYSDIVELVPLGLSSEALPLVAVKVSIPKNESQTDHNNVSHKKKWKLKSHMKPAIWLDGGAHAREWISPAVVTWMLHNLIEGEKGLGADREILNVADFYIMPMINPDGYEHSHTHDRLWKKTRSRSPDHSDDYYVGWFPWNWGRTECVGVDADRNWDYHWGEKDTSNDPCAENYAGPHPFSEPETRAVSEFLAEHRGQIKVYISLHAYSQAWLLPSSHVHATFADNEMLLEMGKLATAALADMYGTKYQVGTAAELRQPASGMSHDWAKARAGIKFSYHVDLRDSFGPYGFLLPGSQIVSTARETWQAVRTIVDNLSDLK